MHPFQIRKKIKFIFHKINFIDSLVSYLIGFILFSLHKKTKPNILEGPKILFIGDSYVGENCGLGDYLYNLVFNINNKVNGITVLILNKHEKNRYKETKELITLDWSLKNIGIIIKTIRKINPNIVNYHYSVAGFNKKFLPCLLPLLLKISTNIKIVSTFHQFYEENLARFWFKLRLTIPLICSDASIFFRHDQLSQLRIQKKIINRMHCIYVGPTLHLEKKTNYSAKLEEEYFLYFGQIRQGKGLEELIDAYEVFQKSTKSNIALIICGTIRDTNYHKKLIEKYKTIINTNKVRFFYDIEAGMLNQLAEKAIASVLLYEDGVSTFRTSFVNVLSVGSPVITTKNNFIPSVFLHKKNIYLINQINRQEIINALSEIVEKRELREILRVGAIKLYQNYFSWNIITQKYLNIYKNL